MACFFLEFCNVNEADLHMCMIYILLDDYTFSSKTLGREIQQKISHITTSIKTEIMMTDITYLENGCFKDTKKVIVLCRYILILYNL